VQYLTILEGWLCMRKYAFVCALREALGKALATGRLKEGN
jgi:NADH:ubiquinone oxidoreductase subunit H